MTNYQSNYDVTLPFSDTSAQVSLVTTTEQTYTVPGTNAQKYVALFGYAANSSVYVGYNVTAVAPASGTNTTSPNIAFKPDKRFVKGGDVLHFSSPDAAGAQVGISLYSIPG